MAFLPHFRVTLSGTFGLVSSPQEAWSTGYAMGIPGTTPGGLVSLPSSADFDALVTATSAWFARATSSHSSVQHLREIRLAFVGETGHVAKNDQGGYMQFKRVLATPVAGTVGTPLHPFSVACVASLGTPRSGANGRGRMFLPVHAGNVDANGLFEVGVQAGIGSSLAQYLREVNTAITAGDASAQEVRVCVASQGSTLQGTPPSLNAVTSIRIGRVPDTMRSRRRSLKEQYATTTL